MNIYFAGPADSTIVSKDQNFTVNLSNTAKYFPNVKICRSPEHADIIILDERYQYRTWHYIEELLECSFLRRHADRICVLNHDSFARVFLPGMYTSLEQGRIPAIDAKSIPYKRDLWKITPPFLFEFHPQKLFTFSGTFHTHPVRKRLYKAVKNSDRGLCRELQKAFHSHDEMDQKQYIELILDSRFSLCPRGLSPSSYRLYESMQLGRCPVVISDNWIPPDGPDWNSFVLRVPENRLKTLTIYLAENADLAEHLGRIAFQTWNQYFSWPQRYRYFIQMASDFLENRNHRCNLAELHDIWTSKQFQQLYGWTLAGRTQQVFYRNWSKLVRNAPESQ